MVYFPRRHDSIYFMMVIVKRLRRPSAQNLQECYRCFCPSVTLDNLHIIVFNGICLLVLQPQTMANRRAGQGGHWRRALDLRMPQTSQEKIGQGLVYTTDVSKNENGDYLAQSRRRQSPKTRKMDTTADWGTHPWPFLAFVEVQARFTR